MLPGPKPSLESALREPQQHVPRFALVKSPAWANADREMRTAFEDFAGGFGARAEVVANWDMAVLTRKLVESYREVVKQKRRPPA